MKLPEKIQRERKKMGLSQEKLAEKIGVWCRSSPDRRRKLTILTRIYLEFCSVR